MREARRNRSDPRQSFLAWPRAVGKRIKSIRSETPLEVIGVVGAVKHVALDQRERSTVYFPLTQYGRSQSVFFAVRTNADPSSLAGTVRSQVWALDRNQPIADLQPMQNLVGNQSLVNGSIFSF